MFGEADARWDVTVGSRDGKLQKLADPTRSEALEEVVPYLLVGPFEKDVVSGPAVLETEQSFRIGETATVERLETFVEDHR